jgi:hypothetical protein
MVFVLLWRAIFQVLVRVVEAIPVNVVYHHASRAGAEEAFTDNGMHKHVPLLTVSLWSEEPISARPNGAHEYM